ncbi:hypothetical protein SECTIM467_63 [Brevibacillus phage SecTim467]|uniref:Uncharacterized protein n=2 Tax=Jenstvirus jenst TaxID=1982225 RepID=A0A0K2CPQ2_9CAUD|nr:hypothetical protein AVV11_gp128 [Brevibacillus phage Jenst]ALA07192.1 hypothetical protein JENST_63 [Brevibacillus phage Jenst]ALA07559.1 hypothetical protein SECTIM467_63 [Brevibacillus phage SecTim467]
MKKGIMKKGIVSTVLTLSLLAPATGAFAEESRSNYDYNIEESLKLRESEDSEEDALLDLRVPSESRGISAQGIDILSAYGKVLFEADFKVKKNFQLPYTVRIKDSDNDSIRIMTDTERYTSSNDEFTVLLEAYNDRSESWYIVDRVTCKVGQKMYEHFYDLKTYEEYRLTIKGNVQGTITVFQQTR